MNFFLFFLVYALSQGVNAEDVFSVNPKKSLHRVSEKFVSISVDPAILLTGINIGGDSAKLAKNLSPAYVRLGGPSTSFIHYVQDEEMSDIVVEDVEDLKVNPALWASVNDWLISANLTAVLAINDNDRVNGEWSPKSMLPMFDLTDKLNITCYFQLGYDSSNKTLKQYKEDLIKLKHLLDAFPDKKNQWKIIGSDLSRLKLNNEETKKLTSDLENIVDGFMWEPEDSNTNSILIKEMRPNIFGTVSKAKIPLWTTSRKENHPISFDSALDWAEQIGKAANLGFEVIYRQPRIHEISTETPVFWVSYFHKKLMGQTVLDLKSNLNPLIIFDDVNKKEASVYAHCTRIGEEKFQKEKENSLRRKTKQGGAITLFVVNDNESNYKFGIKLPNSQIKNFEIQSYILTHEAGVVFCNNVSISLNSLEMDEVCVANLRKSYTSKQISFDLEKKSVGFFVISNAKLPVCIEEEKEKVKKVESFNFDSKLKNEKIFEKKSVLTKHMNLNAIYKNMAKELEDDLKYYKDIFGKNKEEEKDKIVTEEALKEKISSDVQNAVTEKMETCAMTEFSTEIFEVTSVREDEGIRFKRHIEENQGDRKEKLRKLQEKHKDNINDIKRKLQKKIEKFRQGGVGKKELNVKRNVKRNLKNNEYMKNYENSPNDKNVVNDKNKIKVQNSSLQDDKNMQNGKNVEYGQNLQNGKQVRKVKNKSTVQNKYAKNMRIIKKSQESKKLPISKKAHIPEIVKNSKSKIVKKRAINMELLKQKTSHLGDEDSMKDNKKEIEEGEEKKTKEQIILEALKDPIHFFDVLNNKSKGIFEAPKNKFKVPKYTFEVPKNTFETPKNEFEAPKDPKHILEDIQKLLELNKKSTTRKPLIVAPEYTRHYQDDLDVLKETLDDSLMEDLPQHDLLEDFGEQFKLGDVNKKNVNEFWQLENYGRDEDFKRIPSDIDALLSDDVPVFKNDKKELKKTMKNLDDYFKKTKDYQKTNDDYLLEDIMESDEPLMFRRNAPEDREERKLKKRSIYFGSNNIDKETEKFNEINDNGIEEITESNEDDLGELDYMKNFKTTMNYNNEKIGTTMEVTNTTKYVHIDIVTDESDNVVDKIFESLKSVIQKIKTGFDKYLKYINNHP